MPAVGAASTDRFAAAAPAGDERPGVVPADIVFVIGEKHHPSLRRDGNDLIFTTRVPLADALCGTTVKVPHPSGEVLEVPIQDVITPSYAKIIRWAAASGGRLGCTQALEQHVCAERKR